MFLVLVAADLAGDGVGFGAEVLVLGGDEDAGEVEGGGDDEDDGDCGEAEGFHARGRRDDGRGRVGIRGGRGVWGIGHREREKRADSGGEAARGQNELAEDGVEEIRRVEEVAGVAHGLGR